MSNSLIKKVINVNDVPRISKESTNKINDLLVSAINEIKDGQAAELSEDVYKATTLRWHLRRLIKNGSIEDNVKIITRDDGDKKKSYLIRKRKQ